MLRRIFFTDTAKRSLIDIINILRENFDYDFERRESLNYPLGYYYQIKGEYPVKIVGSEVLDESPWDIEVEYYIENDQDIEELKNIKRCLAAYDIIDLNL